MRVTTAFVYAAMPLEQKIDVMVSVRKKIHTFPKRNGDVSWSSYGGVDAGKTNIDIFFYEESGAIDAALGNLTEMGMAAHQMRKDEVSNSPILLDAEHNSNRAKLFAEVVYLVEPFKPNM